MAQRQMLRFAPGSSGLGGLEQAGDDPSDQAMLRSDITLGHDVTLFAQMRYVDSLPKPAVPSYVELDARLRWSITDALEVAVSGRNLLHARHVEFAPNTPANVVPRSVLAETRWRF
jgi:iron complex outermembrane receptor protein